MYRAICFSVVVCLMLAACRPAGAIGIRIENRTDQTVEWMRVVVSGDSAEITLLHPRRSQRLWLFPTTDSHVELESPFFTEGRAVASTYFQPRELPGRGRVVIELREDTVVVRRHSHEWS